MEEIAEKEVEKIATEELQDEPIDDPLKPDVKDYYAILNIPPNASAKQISAAHKKLSLVYHPDRNENDEGAAQQYVAINEAFLVLNDQEKKSEYDAEKNGERNADNGDDDTPTEAASAGRKLSIGGLSRAFEGIQGIGGTINKSFSRIGDAQLPTEVYESVKTIVESNAGVQAAGIINSKMTELEWGLSADGLVERHGGNMYSLTVSAAMAASGYLIQCRSVKNDKFKMAMFDAASGSLVSVMDSERSRDKSVQVLKKMRKASTSSTLFFTSFDVYHINEAAAPTAAPLNFLPGAANLSTSLFTRLDSFQMCKQQATEGSFIVCVVGDNYIGRSSYSLTAAASHNKAAEVQALQLTDDSLLAHKISLQDLRTRYLETKEIYEAVQNEMKAESMRLDTILLERDLSYRGFVLESVSVHKRSLAVSTGAIAAEEGAAAEATTTAPASEDNHTVEGEACPDGNEASARRLSFTQTTEAMQAAVSSASSAVSSASSAVSSASSAVSSASSTATASASGWMTKRFSMGVDQFSRMKASFNTPAPATPEDLNTATAEQSSANTEDDGVIKMDDQASPTSTHAAVLSSVEDPPAPTPAPTTGGDHEASAADEGDEPPAQEASFI